MHLGIETDVTTGVESYLNSYPVLTDEIINESIKLEILIPKVHEWLKQFNEAEVIHEYEIDTDDYKGYVDLIVKDGDECLVVDFKYSNSIEHYKQSNQLHIYKHYLDQLGFNVTRLGYLFIEKVNLKYKKKESQYHFRQRLTEAVEQAQLTYVPIEYDEHKSLAFEWSIKAIENETEWEKNPHGECFACNAIEAKTEGRWTPIVPPNYINAIQNENGEITMALPQNKRRELVIDERPDYWLYADSYTGKSTFVDKTDNLLFLNTDGNTDNTTAPVISIADEVKKTGRIKNRKLAWDVFLETIDDLELEENTFEAVCIDLIEDLLEHCRAYVFDKNNWEHESDGEWGKGWGMVQTEFNNAIKRLKMLGYQIIYISKEKVTEIKLKGGATRTTYGPNIGDKQANFLSGTVDLTMRAYVADDDKRYLMLTKQADMFGGGRFDWLEDEIELDMKQFMKALTEAQESSGCKRVDRNKDGVSAGEDTEDQAQAQDLSDISDTEAVKPKRGRRKKKEEVESDEDTDTTAETEPQTEEVDEDVTDDDEAGTEEADTIVEEPKPRRQRRSRKVKETEDDESGEVNTEEKNTTEDNQSDAGGDEPERPRRRRRSRS